ncbi:MAG: phosphomannomutase/phosphoglucomutase [Candidatus Omnitrophica bacterium]|nr:phosphomannomutase/phosphoglucomutase [Candidatus Omnitrophota bacterium]
MPQFAFCFFPLLVSRYLFPIFEVLLQQNLLNKDIFRAYDIRGIADRDLTDDVIYRIGLAFGTSLIRLGKKQATLGRDIRPSSVRIRTALAKGITETGVLLRDVGVVTTPAFYFSIRHFNADGGIMITGSHNPAEFNGLKVCIGHDTIAEEKIQQLRVLAESGDFAAGRGMVSEADVLTPYKEYFLKQFKFKRKFKVVVDSGNGTGGIVNPAVIRSLGQDVIELYSEPDSRFPHHHPDPTIEKNLLDIIARVKKEKADVGFAYDGDADRVGVIDDKGDVIWGDKLLILFAREILNRKGRGTFVAEVKCSQTFYDDIRKRGGDAVMWKAGHSLIKAKMRETNADLGGEMSGHMFFKDRYFGFDDALYASCRTLEIMDQAGGKLSALLSDIPKTYATPEIRMDIENDEKKFQIIRRVIDYFKQDKRYEVIDIDGVRVVFQDGWGLVRASNTQPVLVLRFEAASEKRRGEIQNLIEGKVREFSK